MYTYPVVEGLEITIDIIQYLITWFRPRFILKLAEKKIPKVKNILWFMGGAISQRIKSNMIYYYNKKY